MVFGLEPRQYLDDQHHPSKVRHTPIGHCTAVYIAPELHQHSIPHSWTRAAPAGLNRGQRSNSKGSPRAAAPGSPAGVVVFWSFSCIIDHHGAVIVSLIYLTGRNHHGAILCP
jgi:hypothetical protein